ncbi:PorP/SprF family type IX secretion system membrane protein [Portibacter marinus]|uniref:PorP/SprF family type IX secretion system membrane protein n=1 Tax=Portibacter marinus TaxID=2898660 RepID=UPI001F1933ED|nr:PorP/SprF family type IX secretion system membrane protein [Portibacter marinus]
MKKILIALVLVVGMFLNVQAQERSVYTHHFINPVLINPAASGFNGEYNILVNYNNKWSGFSDGPKAFTLSYDGPIADRLSIGAILFRDGFAALETTKGQLSFAYKIPADNYEISFGLATEYLQFGLGGPAIASPLVDLNDPSLQERLSGARFFDVAFATYGTFNDNVKFGLVIPGLVRARLDDNEGDSDRTNNYILHLGYAYDVPNYDFTIEPSLFIKQLRNVPFHADINVKLGFMEDQLMGGLSYGIGYDRLGFLLGTQVNNFNILYSYNVSMTDSQSYHNGMHEITLGFNINRMLDGNTMNN